MKFLKSIKLVALLLFSSALYADNACKLTWSNFKDMITGEAGKLNSVNQKISDIDTKITQVTDQYNSAVKQYNAAKKEYDSTNTAYKKLQAEVAANQASAKAAKEQSEKLQEEQKVQSQQSDVWSRGRIGIVVNKTTNITYSVKSVSGAVLGTIVPGGSSSLSAPFADYSQEKTGINGAVEFVPEVASSSSSSSSLVALTSTNSESDLAGMHYFLSFNLQGMNQPGYMYGSEGQLCISRGYPSGSTRAQCVDISSIVTNKDQIWEVEIEIDYIDSNKVYPRIVAIKTQTVAASSLTQNLKTATINQATVKITQANMNTDLSYPSTQGSIGREIWKDVPVK